MTQAGSPWQLMAVRLMSACILGGFVVFAVCSASVGISKQSVYTGIVGYWLGLYLLVAGALSLGCLTLIAWMACTGRAAWKRCAATFATAWTLTVLAYVTWHLFAQTQMQALDRNRPPPQHQRPGTP